MFIELQCAVVEDWLRIAYCGFPKLTVFVVDAAPAMSTVHNGVAIGPIG